MDDSADDGEGLAPPLSEEEMEDYVPLSAEEITGTVNAFEELGLKM